MKNIIVTGGCGYIGSRLVPILLEAGYIVKVIDKLDFNNNLSAHTNLSIDTRDVLLTSVDDYAGYDCVIHLAGLSNDPMANFSPKDNFIQNLGVSGLVAHLAKRAGVKRFIFASSCSVYGNESNNLCDESMIPIAAFPYGVSKVQTEYALLSMHDESFKVTCLRQATVFGWAPRMRTDLVVNTMTKTSILEKKIYLHDDSVFRPLIHIYDLCLFYKRLLEKESDTQFFLNVSTKNYSLKEISQEVKYAVKEKIGDVEIVCKNLTDPRSYCVDNSVMEKELGNWNYKTIEDGVNELLAKTDIDNIEFWNNPDWVNLEMYKRKYRNE